MYIITNSKNQIKITDSQYEALIEMMNDPTKRGVEIDKRYISFGDIAIILSDEDFKEKYPSKDNNKPFWQEDVDRRNGEKPYIIKVLQNEMSTMATTAYGSLYGDIADRAIKTPKEKVLSRLETSKGVICDGEIDGVKFPFSYSAYSLAYKALNIYRYG